MGQKVKIFFLLITGLLIIIIFPLQLKAVENMTLNLAIRVFLVFAEIYIILELLKYIRPKE